MGMRLALPAGEARRARLAPGAAQRWAMLAASALVAAVGATLVHDRLFHDREAEAPAASGAAEAGPRPGGGPDPATTVALNEGKFASAGIQVGAARAARVAREVAVAGRVEADPNRRIEVRPKAPGVVASVPVQPGTHVRAGDVLVILASAEVGSARLLVRERQRALLTARAEAQFRREVASNAEAMVAQLRAGDSAHVVAKEFEGKLVGTARGTLVAAWADYEIAAHEFGKQSKLHKGNVVGEHQVFVAEHSLEGAQARFAASLEQVRFDVAQQARVAQQAARDAEEMVVDAAQRLQLLGVPEDSAQLIAHPEAAADLPRDLDAATRYPIVAPFDGTVTATLATVSRRVADPDPLFVLTDLSRVYAVAHVPESDLASLPALGAGAAVHLSAEAYPGRTFRARLLYTGAEVDPQTRTVRLVAEADNPDGLLKLGLFARIVLDTLAVEDATVVPPGALVQFDGLDAVFRPDPGAPRTFTRVPVRLGRSTPEGRVVRDGLKPGDPVVTAGAFLLKSELILQNETDEE